ncbi:MAG: hypothetical protein AAGM67_20135, partial [Bacteroidota bacterium]
MKKIIVRVKKTVCHNTSKILPEKLAIIFDGWTESRVHYIAVFAAYMCQSTYKETLLTFSPLLSDENFGAAEHVEFFESVLEGYEKSLRNVVAFIGDNCSTNRKISNDTQIPLIGCAAHRCDLAVNAWINENESLCQTLNKLQILMRKLRTLKNSGRLRAKGLPVPILPNDTRWLGRLSMVKRYFQMEEGLVQLEFPFFDISPIDRQVLESCQVELSRFESITVNLQAKGLRVGDIRLV